MDNSPIGVFDSGMGGLSVWSELKRALPHESLIYYGDGLNCPYGARSPQDVCRLTEDAVVKLIAKRAKLIVLACNTATMAAVGYLRQKYDVPFVGMEPALKPAALSTKSGTVGVLATRSALRSEWFESLKGRYSPEVKIIAAEGGGFVDTVESGRENDPRTMELVRAALEPILAEGADQIVLGCTHYPFLLPQMKMVVGSRNVEIIDPAPAIVKRVEWLLDESDLRARADNTPYYDFLSAADCNYLLRLRAKADTL